MGRAVVSGVQAGKPVTFEVISLFPEMFSAIERSGITRRAMERSLWQVRHTNPRDFATDAHRTVDDRPYGGGPGMVLLAEPLERALAAQPQWAAHDRPQPQMIWDLIGDIGLDMAKARANADGPAVAQVLRQDVADMQALKVDRTPGFFVNGTPLREFGEAQLKALVEQEHKKASTP